MKKGKESKKERASLSFGKLAALLSSKGYILVTIYCGTDGDIYFIETRTPKVQKTFIISIPSKYKMVINSETERYKTVIITKINGGIETRQMEYITEIRGPLLDCDILSISSTLLCLCKNNTEVEIYKFGTTDSPNEIQSDMENLEENTIDPVENILKTAKKIDKKMNEEDTDGEELEGEEGEELEEPLNDPLEEKSLEKEILDEDSPEEQIELEFEDENGNPFDAKKEEVETLMVNEVIIPDVVKKETKDIKVHFRSESTNLVRENSDNHLIRSTPKDERRRDNSVPENIENVDISLGIIYYSIEIGLFNKKISVKASAVSTTQLNFEQEVMTVYDTIDDNESSLRAVKLDEIIEMSAKLALKAKEDVEKCTKEELNIKTQILKLSSVLDHCEKMKLKMETKPEQFTDLKPEIERLYKQTKTTLYEMNVEILRNKDRTDEILSQYQTSLEELLDT